MAGLLDYQQPEQAAPGTFGNLTPQQIGLLNAGLSMMSAPKYASIGNGLVRGTSFGERVGPGIQQGLASLQQAQQDQHERAMQQAQMAQSFVKAKQEQDKLAKQEMLHKELSSLQPTDINGIKKALMKYSTDPKELLQMLAPDANRSTYEFLNTDQGIVKGNKSTGALERALIDNGIVRNSNASPELQGQIASAKTHGSEMQKLFKTTDANGNEIFPTGAEVSNGNDIYSRIADAVLPNLIQTESSGNPNAISPKGAVGLTQIMPETAANPGYGVKPLQDNSPEEQKRFGRDYLAAMLKANGGDIHKALSAYNAGQGNQAAAGDYSRKVFGQSEAQKQQIKTDAAIAEQKAKNDLEIQKTQNEKMAGIKYNAEQASPLLEKALELLPKAVSGGGDTALNSTLEFMGISTDKSKAQAQLNAVANDLTSKVPKAPGAQSDIELKYAQKQAGDLANSMLPAETRMAAAKYLYERNQKILRGEEVQPPNESYKNSDLEALRAKYYGK